MENLSYLFGAYAAVWGLVFVYVLSLARRSQSLEREIGELRELLERRGSGGRSEG